jgi:hypothetical protein
VKTVSSLLFCAALSSAAVGAEKSIPAFPTELKLASGATLRNTRVERWEKDVVVVRHAGGIDPVRFTTLAPESRAKIDEILKAQNEPRVVRGTVFVTTRGAGAYKFANTIVIAYPQSAFPSGASKPADGAVPLGLATTNADGRFEIKLKDSKPAVLYCVAHRRAAGDLEVNRWVVPIRREEMDLSEINSLD